VSLPDLDVLKRETAIEWLQDKIIAHVDGKQTVNDIIAAVSIECGVARVDVSYALVRATDSRIMVHDNVVTLI
jgi:hypothetical protein